MPITVSTATISRKVAARLTSWVLSAPSSIGPVVGSDSTTETITEPEMTSAPVERRVAFQRELVRVVAEQREPARVAHDDVEFVAVHHEQTLAVGRGVDAVAHDLDAAEAFYRDVFELEIVRKLPGQFVFFRCGQQMLLVFDPEKSRKADPENPIPRHGAAGEVGLVQAIERALRDVETDLPGRIRLNLAALKAV